MKTRIPLVGQPNQRNLDSLQALIEGKDQRFQNGLIIPVNNPLSGTVKHYFEKRPGLEENCPAAHGDRGFNIFYSRTTGKTLAFFVDADDIHTPYVDCVDVGPFDLQETPEDRGDGAMMAVSDNTAGGAPPAMITTDNGVTWAAHPDFPVGKIYNGIAANREVFVAITADTGTDLNPSHSCVIYDGTTATTVALPTPHSGATPYLAIRYIHATGKFYALAGTVSLIGCTIIESADNGQTWTRWAKGPNFNPYSIGYKSDIGRWNIAGNGGGFYSDNDGTTWTSFPASGLPFGTYRDCQYIEDFGLFIACRISSPSRAFYSANGIDYTEAVAATERLAYSGTHIVTSPIGYYTTDGINYTAGTFPATPPVFTGGPHICFNGAVFVIGTYANEGWSARTSDPTGTWTVAQNMPNVNVTGLAARYVL